jgi:O-methyltransferase domain
MDTQAAAIEQTSLPPQAIILQIAMGPLVSEALAVAVRLGIPDYLAAGERHVDDIAAHTGTHSPSIYRILRTLASTGVFAETSPRTFVNTPVSEVLRSDVPGSMRNAMIFMAEPWHTLAWGNMMHSARTGETAWKATYGEEVFDWFAKHPAESEIFNAAMTDMSGSVGPAVVDAYDFSGIDTLADIAGGHGFLLSQILKANPNLKGILFDLDHVAEGASEMLIRHGAADRVKIAAGDFFKEVPAADAYIMKHIIHDWDDGRSILIMRNIHKAMIGDGKLLLLEMVVPEGNEPHPSKMLDLEMLTLPGGVERTANEYAKLFEESGFKLNRIVPTKSPFSVIEAVKG